MEFLKSVFKYSFMSGVLLCCVATPAFADSACCQTHGGDGQCNISTGFIICKDGLHTQTCPCQDSGLARDTSTTETRADKAHAGDVRTQTKGSGY